jgi:hypothetical protein
MTWVLIGHEKRSVKKREKDYHLREDVDFDETIRDLLWKYGQEPQK